MTKGLPRSLSNAPPLRSNIIKQTIPVRDLAISVVGATGVGFGSAVAGGLPEGNILFLGAVANLSFAGSGSDANLVAAWDGDFGVGTTPAGNGTLSGADVDLVGSTVVGPAVAEVSPVARGTGAVQSILDNTAGTLEVNLSLLIDDADIGGTVPITANGEIYLSYVMLGDD